MLVLIWRGAEGCGHSQSLWTVILAGLTWARVLHFRKAQASVGGKGAGGCCFWEGVALQGRGCALDSEDSLVLSLQCLLPAIGELPNPTPSARPLSSLSCLSCVTQETVFP